jgi:hypothetical protein
VCSVDDDYFVNTDTSVDSLDTVLWFDTAQSVLEGDSRGTRLHSGPTVSAADRIARDGVPVLGSSRRRASINTVGYVRVRLAEGDRSAKTYSMTFGARGDLGVRLSRCRGKSGIFPR